MRALSCTVAVIVLLAMDFAERPAHCSSLEPAASSKSEERARGERTKARKITQVLVDKGEEAVHVTLVADGKVGDYKSFKVENPARLVIDIWNVKKGYPKSLVQVDHPLLKRVRLGVHPKKTRFVFDPAHPQVPQFQIKGTAAGLVVSFGRPEEIPPKVAGLGTVTGIDFKQMDHKSRIVVSTSQVAAYDVFRRSETEVALDLKKMRAPKRLKRGVDTKAFDSAVDYISLYNVKSETSRDMRMIIRLRQTVDFEATQEGKRIYMDFQKPAKAIAPRQAQKTTEAAESEAPKEKAAEEDLEDLDKEYLEEGEEEVVTIRDPIWPINKAFYYFNDKLYFWGIKPLARGYNFVVPERGRIWVRNFFKNVTMPIRAVNCVLQGKGEGFGTEIARFVVNTTWGVLGFGDPAKSRFDLEAFNEDFGQTLGVYRLGHGIYIVWPFLGPSSVRDTVGFVGDRFLNPITYVEPWELSLGITAYKEFNGVSLRIGDYEALKEAAIDPYIGIRDAYVQHRKKKVEE